MNNWREKSAGCLSRVLMLTLVLVIAVAAEILQEPLSTIDLYLGNNPDLAWMLKTTLGGAIVIGSLLMLGAAVAVRVGDEYHVRSGPGQLEPAVRSERRRGWSFFRGWSIGRGFSDEATLTELKAAWRSGAWRTEPRWQRFFLIIAGALLVFVGILGLVFVVGPPVARLLTVGMFLYAVVQVGRGLYRA